LGTGTRSKKWKQEMETGNESGKWKAEDDRVRNLFVGWS
jgi:hypothetical protein